MQILNLLQIKEILNLSFPSLNMKHQHALSSVNIDNVKQEFSVNQYHTTRITLSHTLDKIC